MAVVITINGVNKTDTVRWESVSREENQTKESGKLYFNVMKVNNPPEVGDEVILTIDSVRHFAGYVVEVRETIKGLITELQIICKDYSYELNRLLVSKTYSSTNINKVIRNLINTFAPDFSDGLQSYYKFDDTAIDEADDNDLTNTNVTYSTGKINNGAVFNGSSAKLLATAPVIPNGAKTISFWLKTSQSSATYPVIMENCDRFANNYGTSIYIWNNNKFVFQWRDASGDVKFSLSSPSAINDGIWRHFACVWDGTTTANAVKLYINGVLSDYNTSPTTETHIPSQNLQIGNGWNGSGWFGGSLDELGIWNRALSVDEILELYNSGNGESFEDYSTINCDQPVEKIVFNYLPVANCLQNLTDLVADYAWYVDYNKRIHFFQVLINSPSLFLTDTTGNYVFGSLNTHEDTHQLRNEVIVRGGLLTSETAKEELLSGDGTKYIFPLATKFAEKPVVKVGGVTKTVGINNLDTGGFDCYWDYNEKSLEFNTPPADAENNISVEQIFEYPLILQKRDESSIVDYGVFQQVIVDKTIKDLETAGYRADAELIKYSQPMKTANFKTRLQGIKAGDVLNIQSAIRDVDDNYRINMVRSRFFDPISGVWEHTVEAMTSEDVGINDILARLLVRNPSAQIQIAQGEVVSRIRQFVDGFNITDSVPVASRLATAEYTWTSGANPLIWNFGSWEYTYRYDNGELYNFSVWEV